MAVERFRYIDFLKGVCCLLMLVAHALLVDVVFHDPFDSRRILAALIIYAAQLVVPIFYMASGINALTFLERHGRDASFNAVRFYLVSAAALFVGGYTYSLLVGSFSKGVPDIFQCVAMGVTLTFLLVKLRAPSWLMTLLSGAIFAVALIHRATFEPGPDVFAAMPAWRRFAFGHFAFFPWAGFFPLGVVLHRLRSRVAVGAWLSMFFIMAALGVMTPGAYPESEFGVMFRVDLRFFLTGLGLSGALMLLGARIYPDRAVPGLQFVEYIGRESMLFLIFHALILGVLLMAFAGRIDIWMRAVIEMVATCALLPRLAAMRDRWSATPAFSRRTDVILIAFTVLALLTLRTPAKNAAILFAIPAAWAFAFVYPTWRVRIRAWSARKPIE